MAEQNVNANAVPGETGTTTLVDGTSSQGVENGNRADTSRGPGDTQQGSPQKPVFTYTEDRSRWIPDHRLKEVSGKAEAAQKRADALEAQIVERDRKIQALAGLTPKNADEVDEEGIRAALYKISPELAKLAENGNVDRLLQVLDQVNGFQETQNRYWGGIADNMLEGVKGEISKAFGGDLTPRQTAKIERMYRLEAEAAMEARKRNPDTDYSNDFLARHTRGDKSLVAEFAKEFVDDFFEPARRQATAAAVRRTGRPVPNGRSGEPVVTKKAAIDYGDEDKFKEALTESLQRHLS